MIALPEHVLDVPDKVEYETVPVQLDDCPLNVAYPDVIELPEHVLDVPDNVAYETVPVQLDDVPLNVA